MVFWYRLCFIQKSRIDSCDLQRSKLCGIEFSFELKIKPIDYRIYLLVTPNISIIFVGGCSMSMFHPLTNSFRKFSGLRIPGVVGLKNVGSLLFFDFDVFLMISNIVNFFSFLFSNAWLSNNSKFKAWFTFSILLAFRWMFRVFIDRSWSWT